MNHGVETPGRPVVLFSLPAGTDRADHTIPRCSSPAALVSFPSFSMTLSPQCSLPPFGFRRSLLPGIKPPGRRTTVSDKDGATVVVRDSPADLAVSNHALLATNTWLYQFPFWNEPHRPLWLTPRYLAWGTQDLPLAYVCILSVGFRPAKIGLVFRGPTSLQAGVEIPADALLDLLNWARTEGYMFVRFTHSDAEVLSRIASLRHTETTEAFPYFLDYPMLSPDYVVEQCATEGETLASFDREARRKISPWHRSRIRVPLRQFTRSPGADVAALPGMRPAQTLSPGASALGLHGDDAAGASARLRPRLFRLAERQSGGQHVGGSRPNGGALRVSRIRRRSQTIGCAASLEVDAGHVRLGRPPLQPWPRPRIAGPIQTRVRPASSLLPRCVDGGVEREMFSSLEADMSCGEVHAPHAAQHSFQCLPLKLGLNSSTLGPPTKDAVSRADRNAAHNSSFRSWCVVTRSRKGTLGDETSLVAFIGLSTHY